MIGFVDSGVCSRHDRVQAQLMAGEIEQLEAALKLFIAQKQWVG